MAADGPDSQKGTSTQKLQSRDMLIKSELTASQEKRASEDDYHLLKRTVWQQMAKPEPMAADPKAQHYEPISKLFH